MNADFVLSAEPSGTNAISFSSKGYAQFNVSVSTRGAIAGYSNESKSAIRIAASIIHELDELENIKVSLPKTLSDRLADKEWGRQHELLRGKEHACQLGKTTTDIRTINGGSLNGVIAPDCSFTASTVIPVGVAPKSIYRRVRRIVSYYPEAKLHWEGADAGDLSDPDSEAALLLQDTVEELSGHRPVMTPDIAS